MIAAFYGGKSILITGATGFMGKVLMEKLFRTSPDLKVIYILVRTKAGQTTQQRVFQILNSKVCLRGRALGQDDSLQYSLTAPDCKWGGQDAWAGRGEETRWQSGAHRNLWCFPVGEERGHRLCPGQVSRYSMFWKLLSKNQKC